MRLCPAILLRALEQREKHVVHDLVRIRLAAEQAARATKRGGRVPPVQVVEFVAALGQMRMRPRVRLRL